MATTPSTQYLKIKQRHPELINAVESLGKAAKQSGPIDEKTAQLIQLAAAAAIRSEGAVHSHTKRALEAGASVDEIRHALLLLTSTLGFPCVMAAMSWADEKL
ncbi:MAG: carboxymuconolactone decarboxylase family protein [Moritella sp.]|uniref:carboxymuconolactone decarboxylase family protein n=1 Tax=Moritella sp. PE36 TaxID=58051 RepID=UPI0001569776|nr:carboxymuconolactone decarboxylase family protein [Moritella sp. PE36]EDM66135.1 carboxymuconolactone decarboxylase domain protein [Moritella sp. PE36]PHR89365.1 MAG: carboxymuconolactone decarboxylase family protein [Moritella sp.]